MFEAWQPPTHPVIQQQVQPIPTILRQFYATILQQLMIQPSLCQLLCYDSLDTTTPKLWPSLPPIPTFNNCYNKFIWQSKPLSHRSPIDTTSQYVPIGTARYKDTAPLWYYTPTDTNYPDTTPLDTTIYYVTILPWYSKLLCPHTSIDTASYYVTILPLIPDTAT